MDKTRHRMCACDMTDVNLIGVYDSRKMRFSGVEILFIAVPLALSALALISVFLPEIGFLAECQNVPGGDLCSISLK